jgi:hypothetical protein
MFAIGGKPSYRAVRRIERIAERRHTAFAGYIHAMSYLTALDAEEKRFALSEDVCSRIEDVTIS